MASSRCSSVERSSSACTRALSSVESSPSRKRISCSWSIGGRLMERGSWIGHSQLFQRLAQRVARMEEAARDGALGNPQHGRDLGVAQPLELLEHQHLTVVRADPLESAPEQLARGVPLAAALGPGFGVRGTGLDVLVHHLALEAGGAAPQHVAAVVAEDLEEPGAERALVVEALQ